MVDRRPARAIVDKSAGGAAEVAQAEFTVAQVFDLGMDARDRGVRDRDVVLGASTDLEGSHPSIPILPATTATHHLGPFAPPAPLRTGPCRDGMRYLGAAERKTIFGANGTAAESPPSATTAWPLT